MQAVTECSNIAPGHPRAQAREVCRPLKVLHVIDSGGMYGAETVLISLAREQQHLGMAPTILSIGTPGSSPKEIEIEAESHGIPVHAWRMRKGLNLIGGYRIVRFAQINGFKVLHSHGYKGNVLLGWLPRRVRALPVVGTLHGWTATQGWSRMAMNQWLERRMLPRLDAVVAVSAAMLTDPRLARIGADVRVIDNGIDCSRRLTATVDPTIEMFCQDGFIVGAVGRLSSEKGFMLLVEALTLFCRRHADVKAIILGDGPERQQIAQKVADANLEARILLPGFVQEAAAYMHRFNLLVLPSLTEGLPITLLEAMASSVPVVATRVGGIPAALGDGEFGSLVEPGNVEALVDAMERVYRSPARAAATAARAQERVQQMYSSRAMAEAYCRVYQGMLNCAEPGN